MDMGPLQRSGPGVAQRVMALPLRARLRLAAALVIGVLALAATARWLHWQFTHVVLDDARISADMVVMASRVPGWVRQVPVTGGDTVAAGSLLVQVDARDQALAVRELEARLAALQARRAELEAQRVLADHSSASQIQAAQARLEAAHAAQGAAEAERRFAEAEHLRAIQLSATGAATRQRLEQTRAAMEQARQKAIGAAAEIRNAEAGHAMALAAREQLTVLDRQLATLEPQERELTATRDRAALDQQDRSLRMPFAGVVDKLFVDVGEYVLAGQRIIVVHDPDRVRVEANVKETEIRFFRPGTPVTISVDAYPGRRFPGVVDRVIGAATSEFALLPSPNPSGNFTKITQRLPIRVQFDPPPPPGLLRPGMLVRVEAEARE
jgi:membrane fusion protein (multidrug efflux system)